MVIPKIDKDFEKALLLLYVQSNHLDREQQIKILKNLMDWPELRARAAFESAELLGMAERKPIGELED